MMATANNPEQHTPAPTGGAVLPNLPASALVVGLGKSGLSAARFLAAHGVAVAVIDSRPTPPGLDILRRELPEVECVTGPFDAERMRAAELLVLSPGVPLADPAVAAAVAAGVEVVGDVEIFARLADAPVIAITGSNGKSTVTELVGRMAARAGRRVKVGGNIGTPALDLLDGTATDLYVLELSSFQLETTRSLRAAAAVVLNVSPDHMDRYADLAAYAGAKSVIYEGAAMALINGDDPRVEAMAAGSPNVERFTLGEPGEGEYGLRDGRLVRGDEVLIGAGELRIAGAHNRANALAAIALGDSVGIERSAMIAELREFPGLDHRTQWVAERDGVDWYNDSKGTNVGATLAAIHGMGRPVVLIAGGDGKGQEFSPLRAALAEHGRAAVLIGRDAARIERALDGALPLLHAASMDEAVARAAESARPGDCVLLSPACASFDMYSGFVERGERFVEAVRERTSGVTG